MSGSWRATGPGCCKKILAAGDGLYLGVMLVSVSMLIYLRVFALV